MLSRLRQTFACILTIAAAFSTFSAQAETLREQHAVTVSGHQEIWRLVWTTLTVPACPAEELDTAVTCPCAGFAYGEAGTLNLVRVSNGREIDRLNLEAAFADVDALPQNAPGHAILQSRPLVDGDYERGADLPTGHPSNSFIASVASRPITRIMTFKDFDHDGQATEFLLQVGAGPCGHTAWLAVGLSPENPKLHVLTSQERPAERLVMPYAAWDALVKTDAPAPIQTWGCGDHGSDKETRVALHALGGRISAQRITYACDGSDETPGKRLGQAPW